MAETQDIETQPDDLLEMAWIVIANASDWISEGKQQAEWREAAERWRDAYFASLPKPLAGRTNATGGNVDAPAI